MKKIVDKVNDINLKDAQVIKTREDIDLTNSKLTKLQTELDNLKSEGLKQSKPGIKCDKCETYE